MLGLAEMCELALDLRIYLDLMCIGYFLIFWSYSSYMHTKTVGSDDDLMLFYSGLTWI